MKYKSVQLQPRKYLFRFQIKRLTTFYLNEKACRRGITSGKTSREEVNIFIVWFPSILSEFLKNIFQNKVICRLKRDAVAMCKKGIHKRFAMFTEKHLCWSSFFHKVAGCFPANSAKSLRTNILKNIYESLLLLKLTFQITFIEND